MWGFLVDLVVQVPCLAGEWLGLGRGHIAVRDGRKLRCIRCDRVKVLPW